MDVTAADAFAWMEAVPLVAILVLFALLNVTADSFANMFSVPAALTVTRCPGDVRARVSTAETDTIPVLWLSQ